jgi:hypothetical protein
MDDPKYRLHQIILRWDASHGLGKAPSIPVLPEPPDEFASESAYQQYFEPLLLNEFHHEMQDALKRPFPPLQLGNVTKVDNLGEFVFANFDCPRDVLLSMSRDTVYVIKREGTLDRKEHVTMGIVLDANLAQGSVRFLALAASPLWGRSSAIASRWRVQKIDFAFSTAQREFQMLSPSAIAAMPLAPLFLTPRAHIHRAAKALRKHTAPDALQSCDLPPAFVSYLSTALDASQLRALSAAVSGSTFLRSCLVCYFWLCFCRCVRVSAVLIGCVSGV